VAVRHSPPGLAGSYSEKPFSGRQAPAERRCANSRATSESWDLSDWSSDVVSEKLLLQAKR
jgi:hypothetical protein